MLKSIAGVGADSGCGGDTYTKKRENWLNPCMITCTWVLRLNKNRNIPEKQKKVAMSYPFFV